MHARLSIAAAVVLAFSASIGCSHAATYNIGADFTFTPSGDMTANPSGTSDTISELATTGPRGSETAVLNSNFGATGNFTVGVHQTFTLAPNGGSQEIAAFEVGFANGGETVQYVIVNAAGQPVPPFWAGSLTPGLPLGAGVNPLTGDYDATLQVQRIGNIVTLLFNGTPYFSTTDFQYGGAASFLLYYENGLGNPGAGAVTWDNFTIDTGATPLPGTLPLFITGIGALGLLGRRRKPKGAAAVAAA